MDDRQLILIIGNSVRYLAQSAKQAGYQVIGVDLFADTDMQSACHVARKTDNISIETLETTYLDLDLPLSIRWTYSAGFEQMPVQQKHFLKVGECLGNKPTVMQLLASPTNFFDHLDRLSIAYPSVSLMCPAKTNGWLSKAIGGCGGAGVQFANDAGDEVSPGYYQKFIQGALCSLTFLANGSDVQIIGVNKIEPVNATRGDFRFSQALSGFDPGKKQYQEMIRVAKKLTVALQLRGANGLDFVLTDDHALLLELNPRPPATLELYEQVLPGGGFHCHLLACEGQLPSVAEHTSLSGCRVLYVHNEIEIGHVDWPDWCSDRPVPGSILAAGSPLCILHAGGIDHDEIEHKLHDRASVLHSMIESSNQEAA